MLSPLGNCRARLMPAAPLPTMSTSYLFIVGMFATVELRRVRYSETTIILEHRELFACSMFQRADGARPVIIPNDG